MATGRDDFVIAFRSAFLKKKDKQKFSLLTLIFLSVFVIILSNFNLPNTPGKKELLKFLKHDKKNKENKINFSILNGIGNCKVDILLSEDEL